MTMISNAWEHINTLNNFRQAGALSASDVNNPIFAGSHSAQLTRQAMNVQNITIQSPLSSNTAHCSVLAKQTSDNFNHSSSLGI